MQACQSEPSLTSTSWTTIGGSPSRRLRPGSGRFRSDEMACLRKLPVPSASFREKAEVYCQSPMAQKRAQSESGLHTLPAMKGDFYRFSAEHFHPPAPQPAASQLRSEGEGHLDALPMEKPTAAVLNDIFPCESPQEREAKGRTSPTVRRAGSLRASPSSGGRPPAKRLRSVDAQRSLLQFRQRLLDRFATVQSAFALFAEQVPGGLEREMPRKDFSKFLDKHFPGLSREDHHAIFAFLDTNKNGFISISEFHAAIEAAAPVRGLEDLRRKLIALGYLSMRQALREMDAAVNGRRNLGLADFAQALSRVGITEESEHQILFQILLDPYAESKTVTLEQLHCGLAAVSPILLLEDIRYRILMRYPNTSAAFSALDIDCSRTISKAEFVRNAIHLWKMSHHEATKAFSLIDADDSRSISKREFVTAMNLSEPTLFYEDIRRKVRQRFRSIAEALLKSDGPLPASQESWGEGGRRPSGANNWRAKSMGNAIYSDISASDVWDAFHNVSIQEEARVRQTPAALRELLAKVQLKDAETAALFALVDIDGDGEVTPLEFSKGMRFFAPACILDDLRLRCLGSRQHVADAFAPLAPERRLEVLNADGLREVLRELQLLSGVHVTAIVDLLEPHKVGGLSVCELLSALQAAAPGAHVPLSAEMIDARARQQVKAQMSPFLTCARDLRHRVRQKPDTEVPEPATRSYFTSSRLPPMEPLKEVRDDDDGEQLSPSLVKGAAASAAPLPMPGFVQQSYNRVSRTCKQVLKPQEAQPIIQRMRGYYSAAGHTVADHDELLSATAPSRFGNFCALSHHRAVIGRPALKGDGAEPPPPP